MAEIVGRTKADGSAVVALRSCRAAHVYAAHRSLALVKPAKCPFLFRCA
jgi:hypothetical protein